MNRKGILTFILFSVCHTSYLLLAQETDSNTINSYVYESNQIDSLITVNKINSKTILIKFGSDAVSAIKTRNGIIVIDAGISTGLTLKYRKIIENEFNSKNIKYIINTHSHPDHYGGNNVFDKAEVVGHENGIEEIIDQWKDTTKVINRISKIVDEYEIQMANCQEDSNNWIEAFIQKTRYYNALVDAQSKDFIRSPGVTFSDSLRLDMGDVEFEMIFFGKCHSNSDILIYIPELKILFSGDLVFKYGRPSINDKQMADKDKWHRAVKWIEKRIPNIETIISGHGEIYTSEDLKSFNQIILDK